MDRIRTEMYRITQDKTTGKEIKHYRFNIDLGLDKDGKRHTIKKTSLDGKKFHTKRQAEEAGNEYYKRYIKGEIEEKHSDMFFSDFLDIWYDKMCVKMEMTTTDNYEKVIRNHLKPSLGAYLLSAITKPIIEEFLEGLEKKGYEANTIDNIKFTLTKSLRYAYDNSYVKGDINKVVSNLDYSINSKNASNKKLSTQQKNDYITDENFKKIIERFPEGTMGFLPLIISYHLGTRLGETFALTWDDFDFEKKQVIIRRQFQYDKQEKMWYIKFPKHISRKEYTKNGDDAFRKIGVDDTLIEILKREKKKQENNKKSVKYVKVFVDEKNYINYFDGEEIDFVIQKANGQFLTPSNTAQYISKIIHDELKIPFTFHSLRHTHCTNLVKANQNAFYIFYRMGHKSFKTTQKYLHNNDEFITAGQEKLNGMF